MEKAILRLQGMNDERCARSVSSALKAITGVLNVKVSLEHAQATVTYDPGKARLEQFKTAVRAVGFAVLAITFPDAESRC
jgi:copper chaperone